MSYDYSQTYRTSQEVLAFHQYRMSPVHQAILNQEVWAILNLDEKTGETFFRGRSILELGIGGGAISSNLETKLRNSSLIGADVSKNMLKACKANSLCSPRIDVASLVVGDIFHLPFKSSSLDSVLTIRLIPNLVENDLAIREVARILKPDGQVIFDIYNKMSAMSLLDSVLNLFLRRKKKPYKHTCSLKQIIQTCDSAGLPVKSHVRCLLLAEAFFKFVPKQLLRMVMFVDRVVSNLPLFSKISTRVFILARKKSK